jgi:integrase
LRWRQGSCQHWESLGTDKDVMSRAIVRASELNRELMSDTGSATVLQPSTIREACAMYLAAKESASDVGGATICKYRSELARVVEFAEETAPGRRRRLLHQLDSRWCEDFCMWLDGVRATRNGGPVTFDNPERTLSPALKREIKRLLWSVVEHGMLRTPPLIPPGFRNPMSLALIGRERSRGNGVSDPPISNRELAAIVAVLDSYGLGLLASLFLYGPRPSELGHVLRSDYDDRESFLHVVSRPDTGYQTKGRRDKAWPVTDVLAACLRPLLARTAGPLFVKRWVFEIQAQPAILNSTANVLVREFEDRIAAETARLGKQLGKEFLEQVSEEVWAAAGAVDARDVARELQRAAMKTGLPRVPTPKDVRHLVETECEAARMSPGVIRFLLGHAPGRGDALVNYNHTGRGVLREQVAILDERRQVLIEALKKRVRELSKVIAPECREVRCKSLGKRR